MKLGDKLVCWCCWRQIVTEPSSEICFIMFVLQALQNELWAMFQCFQTWVSNKSHTGAMISLLQVLLIHTYIYMGVNESPSCSISFETLQCMRSAPTMSHALESNFTCYSWSSWLVDPIVQFFWTSSFQTLLCMQSATAYVWFTGGWVLKTVRNPFFLYPRNLTAKKAWIG